MSGPDTILRHGVDPVEAKVVCVFVHGRGQSPDEMASNILQRLSVRNVAYLLPSAEGASWYDARATEALTAHTRDQLEASLDRLAQAVDAARADAGERPLVLAGFSQGACLSLEYAFRRSGSVDALVALTGCRVGTTTCERPRDLAHALPVYLTGSDRDPWIPPAAFGEAAAELAQAGAALRADSLPGRGHEVGAAEIAMLDAILSDLASGQSPRMGAHR